MWTGKSVQERRMRMRRKSHNLTRTAQVDHLKSDLLPFSSYGKTLHSKKKKRIFKVFLFGSLSLLFFFVPSLIVLTTSLSSSLSLTAGKQMLFSLTDEFEGGGGRKRFLPSSSPLLVLTPVSFSFLPHLICISEAREKGGRREGQTMRKEEEGINASQTKGGKREGRRDPRYLSKKIVFSCHLRDIYLFRA